MIDDTITLEVLRDSDLERLTAMYNMIPGVRQVTRMSDTMTARKRIQIALLGAEMKLSRDGRVVPKGAITKKRGEDTRLRRIRILAESNPKRPGTRSHARFELYREGMTIGEYVRDCREISQLSERLILRDIYWDTSHGFIALDDGAGS